MKALISSFGLEGMMRYSVFVPRLYNLCKSLGFEKGMIMPSRAFCSDENQGYPIILIAKHFGTFPFNHGRVGGIVADNRHGPHAEHGKDLVIVQASHVGYDPKSKSFGVYRRMQTVDHACPASCGKIGGVLDWYQAEYAYARDNVFLEKEGGEFLISIDNQLLHEERNEGLFLELDRIMDTGTGKGREPVRVLSTSRVFRASAEFRQGIGEQFWPATGKVAIGNHLIAEWFHFRRPVLRAEDQEARLEYNLQEAMPWIVSSPFPLLLAAKVNTQIEFDRTFRTIVREKGYQGKKVVFISSLNIDISPEEGQVFPLTKCVPWAAYIQSGDGSHYTLEQPELLEALKQQSTENPDQICLDDAIHQMEQLQEVRIPLD